VTLGLSPRWTSPLAGMHNTALTTLRFEDERPNLVTYNDIAHLDDL
jgi:hypothetical protein